jgi:hypothetical protein
LVVGVVNPYCPSVDEPAQPLFPVGLCSPASSSLATGGLGGGEWEAAEERAFTGKRAGEGSGTPRAVFESPEKKFGRTDQAIR